ncbi:MAG: aminopeptidase P family protein [Acidobacteriota bacterium]
MLPLFASLLAGALLWSAGALEEHRARRAALSQALPGGVVVLFGRDDPAEGAGHAGFAQEPNFYYLTGWGEPGAVLLLAPERKGAPRAETLFLPARDARTETYSGRRLSAEDEDARVVTGFELVLPRTSFESELRRALEHSPKLYTLADQRGAETLKSLAPLREIADAREALGRLRLKKSPREIELIRKSVDVTVEAHRAAWKRAAPGLHEFQIAATMVGTFLERGCEHAAYPPIVASGPNAIVLHYERNARRLDAGELLLMDVGASCAGYAADITRTIPVSGRFSQRQREIYEVVLGALKATVAAVRPGVMLGGRGQIIGLYKVARDYIDSHGRDRQGNSLGQYLPHAVAHRVGLDVHDVYRETLSLPLEAGDVIAIEPGVYIKEEGIGIRIEEMVLVTEKGALVLSAALPREPGEIEKALAE